MKISKRLELVANYVPKGSVLADIGSDHAYLPCYLVEQDIVKKAIAGEVVEGPFNSAKANVLAHGFNERITVRLGNGLQVIDVADSVNCITICGMGGELIVSILEAGRTQQKLNEVSRLVLQPNVAAHLVREWLVQHHYEIIDEEIVEEHDKIYEIIVAEKTDKVIVYTSDELQFGVHLSRVKNAVFIRKWQLEIEKYDKVISSLQRSKDNQDEKIVAFRQKQAYIRKVIDGES